MEDSQNESISLTDIAGYKIDEPKDAIKIGWEAKTLSNFLVFVNNYIMIVLRGEIQLL